MNKTASNLTRPVLAYMFPDGTVRTVACQDHGETVWPEITFQPAGGGPIITGTLIAGQVVCQCLDCLAANPTR